MSEPDEHEHFGPDCPQCQALTAQARALGSLGEAMQKALDDGTFKRLGAEMARRHNEDFWRRFIES